MARCNKWQRILDSLNIAVAVAVVKRSARKSASRLGRMETAFGGLSVTTKPVYSVAYACVCVLLLWTKKNVVPWTRWRRMRRCHKTIHFISKVLLAGCFRSSQRSFFKHILAAVCCELSVQSAGGRKSARNGTKLIALGDSSGDKLLDFGQA